METVNRYAMIASVYPCLLQQWQEMTTPEQYSAIAAIAEGYAFPTNLDTDPPLDGHAPRPAAHHVQRALNENWSWEKLKETLRTYEARRQA